MAETLLFQLVSPERVLVEAQVDGSADSGARRLYRSAAGPRAAAFGTGAGGVLTYHVNGAKKVVAVYGGFVEVLPDRVRVLADSAENAKKSISPPPAWRSKKPSAKSAKI